jgi:hypothetical protein
MMNGRGKSDSAIVAGKPTNKAGHAASGSAKGPGAHSVHRRFFAHSHDSPLRPHSRDRLSRSMMRSSMS